MAVCDYMQASQLIHLINDSAGLLRSWGQTCVYTRRPGWSHRQIERKGKSLHSDLRQKRGCDRAISTRQSGHRISVVDLFSPAGDGSLSLGIDLLCETDAAQRTGVGAAGEYGSSGDVFRARHQSDLAAGGLFGAQGEPVGYDDLGGDFFGAATAFVPSDGRDFQRDARADRAQRSARRDGICELQDCRLALAGLRGRGISERRGVK